MSRNDEKNMPTEGSVATARRLLCEALPPRWKLYALSLICMISVAGLTAALAHSTRLIVNDVFVAGDASAAVGVALMVMAIALAKSIFQYANAVIAVMFRRSVATAYQKLMFRKILVKDVWHFVGKHAANLMVQVRLFGDACGKVVVGITNSILTDTLTVIALVIVMIIQDPLMSLVAGLLFPVVFLLIANLSRRIRAVANAETEMTGAFFSIGAEAFDGIKTVKSYRLEDKSIRRFEDAVNMLEDRLLAFARITSATAPVMEALGGIVIGLFVMYAAWQTITQGKTPGEFTAFLTAFLMAYQPAQRLSKTWVDLQKSLTHVGRMYDTLDAPVRQRDEGRKTLEQVSPKIRFENVSFEYKSGAPALQDVSFEISSGERIAIVGRSGAGKSTLIDLVLRFYDPTKGRVLIGDIDLREATEKSVRDSVALISQAVFLFDGTIRDNIRDGNPDATEEEIEAAARLAQLHGVMSGLPNGLETRVGPNGSALSGGQKQRVGIARALAKRAKIYIFDEATSALDVENEHLIMEALQCELQGITVLFITHRASTLAYVDRVLMLEAGELVAFDSHDRLQRNNKRYRTLFNLAMRDRESKGAMPESG